MSSKKVSVHTVQMAIQAIELFYEKYGAKFETPTIVALTAAIHDQDEMDDSLELTPCEKAFRRIIITRSSSRFSRKDQIALVFGYDDLDRPKTDELNELINRFTDGKLVK